MPAVGEKSFLGKDAVAKPTLSVTLVENARSVAIKNHHVARAKQQSSSVQPAPSKQREYVRQACSGLRTRFANPLLSRSSLPAITPKTKSRMNVFQEQDMDEVASTGTPSSVTNIPRGSTYLEQLPGVSLVDSDGVEFEGESSLHAHSIAARDLLTHTLNNDSCVRNDPKIVAALKSLRRLVEADETDPSQKRPKLTGLGRPRQLLYELKLPPRDLILDVLRKSKERATFVFSSTIGYLSREHLNKLCQIVFFRTEDYPTSTAIIVYATLKRLLQEFADFEDDGEMRQQYDQSAKLCRTNLEICISNLDLLLSVTQESLQALVLAALYCMQIGQASTCKRLVTHGCMMTQSLGWHRLSSMKDDDEDSQRHKLSMFWTLYVIDKHLSLRLGHASLIQDHDIDLPLPWNDLSAPHTSLGRINLWVRQARVMGLIYQRLYSPGALKQESTARFQAVQLILQELENVNVQTFSKDGISDLVQNPGVVPAPHFYAANDMISRSDEVIYYSLLCMIHRATPTSVASTYDPVAECIKSARAALDCHKSCTTFFKSHDQLWAAYLHWTVLNTPFVPFTTIFGNVLTTHNRIDLKRLQDFVKSMSDCPTSQPAQKLSKLSSIFVNIATVYIDSHEQAAARNSHIEPKQTISSDVPSEHTGFHLGQQQKVQSQQTWMPFDPLIGALGFAEDPFLSMDGSPSANSHLENWFNSYQHIMGLLEDDLSNLDPEFVTF